MMKIMSLFPSIVVVLLCLCSFSLLEAHDGGFSVEIIHRDSSKSPLYNINETHFERVGNAIRRSINRANHINTLSVSKGTPKAFIIPDQGEYLVSYSVGTPPIKYLGILDTGSDIIWLQCQPCKRCYRQTMPIFDPSKSQSYKTLPCFSQKCRSVLGFSCSSQRTCAYFIQYQGGSHSQGDLIAETLTLGSTTGYPVQVPSTVIGCGHDNSVDFQGPNSGVVGLGRGHASLISQLGSSIDGKKFSYCLVPFVSGSKTYSKLNFGNAAVVSGPGTVSTPLVGRNEDVFYYLTLEALSVGRTRIEVGSPRSGGKGNIVIDSGTTLTLLPVNVYSALELAVAKEVRLRRVNDPAQVLNLCYQGTPDKLVAPVITVHFSGADVTLNSLNTFIQVADDVVCFAVLPTQNGAIFGNVAQQNFLVGYDLDNNKVSFKSTDCTKQ